MELKGIPESEVIQQVKDDSSLKHIPIIVLTADAKAEVESLKLGAVDFIAKPYPEREVILARVRRTIEFTEDRDIIEFTERDVLTGLYNRAGVVSVRESMTADRPRTVGVLMADLDHLKQINDRFGHHEGDIALRSVADILRRVLGADQVIGRIGGDEFQACFAQPSEDKLKKLIRRIKERCDDYNKYSERPYFLEISLGYAVGTVQTREEWEALASRADEALYEDKKQRRDFVLR